MQRPLVAICALLVVVAGAGLTACGGSSSSTGGGTKPTGQFTPIGNNSSDFCTQAGSALAQLSHAGSALTNTSPGATPNVGAFKQLIAASATALDSLDSQAPGEIASAFHVLRAAYDQASTQAQSATSIEQVSNVFTAFAQPAVKTASDQVSAYLKNKCGITPQASTAAPVTPAATP